LLLMDLGGLSVSLNGVEPQPEFAELLGGLVEGATVGAASAAACAAWTGKTGPVAMLAISSSCVGARAAFRPFR
jgi:hypothetical protein